mgnify:FL=1|jgi:hypothetical protein
MNTKKIIQLVATISAIAFLPSCGTKVIPSGPDTYSVSSSGAGFSTAGVRARVYTAANDYCNIRGLVMVPVSADIRGGVYGQRAPSADLVFRALKPGDPDIKRPNVEGPDHTLRVQNR